MLLRVCQAVLLCVVLLASACQPASAIPSDETAAAQVSPPSSPSPVWTANPSPASATPRPSPSPVVPPPSPSRTPTVLPVTTLLFTGVIVPARCVQAAIDASGDPDYPYEAVREVITRADVAVGTLNAVISDYPPHTGCVPTYVLVGSADNADALARAGFDVMSVATNHIKNCGPANCGDRPFLETLDNLRRVGIQPVGAGVNHAAAMQPVVVTV